MSMFTEAEKFMFVPTKANTIDELRRGSGSLIVQPSTELAASPEYQEYLAEQAERRAKYEEAAAARYAERLTQIEAARLADLNALTDCVGLTITAIELFAGDGADDNKNVDTLRLTLSDGRKITAVASGYDAWSISTEVQA